MPNDLAPAPPFPPPRMTRRCSTCRRWTPRGDAGVCSDPTTRARPTESGVAGTGKVLDDGRVVTAADAVCPRWAGLPVRLRTAR